MTTDSCTAETVEAQTHEALFYRGPEDYLDGILRFIGPGLAAGEPVAVAIPAPKADLLRQRLNGHQEDVELLDMFQLGHNPARIIPAVQAMLERSGGQRLHYVGEPIWAGRSPAQIREATRHEALINLAWPGARIRVLCPYDTASLDPAVLADAEQTHPYLIRDGETFPSEAYTGPDIPPGCEHPLSAPPTDAATLEFGLEELAEVRALVGWQSGATGLSSDRTADLVLAVNELATNTIRHAGTRGLLRVWEVPDEVVCQIEDPGHISDPLAGRRRPPAIIDGGLGLWMVNQLCDLVELRSSAAGTAIRAHMHLS